VQSPARAEQESKTCKKDSSESQRPTTKYGGGSSEEAALQGRTDCKRQRWEGYSECLHGQVGAFTSIQVCLSCVPVCLCVCAVWSLCAHHGIAHSKLDPLARGSPSKRLSSAWAEVQTHAFQQAWRHVARRMYRRRLKQVCSSNSSSSSSTKWLCPVRLVVGGGGLCECAKG